MDFSVKAHQSMTHKLPATSAEREDIFSRFTGALRPLVAEGKLAAILFQFPYGFTPTGVSYSYLAEVRDRLPGFPVVVELRNAAWDHELAKLTTFLHEHDLSYCAVDLPRLKGLPSLHAEVTAEPAYLRLHGRNETGSAPPARSAMPRWGAGRLRHSSSSIAATPAKPPSTAAPCSAYSKKRGC